MGDNVYLGDRNGVRTPDAVDGRLERRLLDAPTPSGCTSPSSRTPSTATRRSTSRASAARRTRSSTGRGGSSRCAGRRRVFGRGSIEFLNPANHRVLAYVRSLDSEKVLVVNNLSGTAQAVELDLHGAGRRDPHRDVRAQPLPADPRAALRDDARPLRLLLVQAALAVSTILSDELLSELMAVGQVDVLVGLPTLNHADSVGPVVRAAHVAFNRELARERTVLAQRGRGLDRRHARHRPGRLDRGPGDAARLAEPAHAAPHQRAVPRGAREGGRACAPSSPPPTSSRRGRSSSSTPRSRA